ncbi:MAG: hypothetical protein ACRED0_11625 [Gammaproteobacteria bacterium]
MAEAYTVIRSLKEFTAAREQFTVSESTSVGMDANAVSKAFRVDRFAGFLQCRK